MRIQLITFAGCPNAPLTRAALERVLAASGIAGRIEEVDVFAPETPEALRRWGSPTVLLNGEDVEGQTTPTGTSCRLYTDDEGNLKGAPPEPLLVAAVRRAISGSLREDER